MTAESRAYLDRLIAMRDAAGAAVQRVRGVWSADAIQELERDHEALCFAVGFIDVTLDRSPVAA